MYDGTNWVIMGDPVIESYFTTDSGYEKKANGLIVQWGLHKTQTNVHEITLDVSYSNTDYVIMAMGQDTSEYANANIYGYAVSANKIRLDTSQLNWKVYMHWFTKGY